MSEKETAMLFAAICMLYPRDKTFDKPDIQTIKVWHLMLADIDYSLAEAAVQMHATKSQWPPSLAEIRQNALNAISPTLDGDQAYALVRTAMRKYGSYQAREAMKSLPEDVREAVNSYGGFTYMCHSEEPEIQRAQFLKLWETMKKRKQQDELLPPDVRQLVSNFNRLPQGDV